MKHLLPGKVELAIFSTLALICGAIASTFPAQDLALAALAIPVFMASAIMGLRRNVRFAPVRESVRPEQQQPQEA